jgi:hypothetical protein
MPKCSGIKKDGVACEVSCLNDRCGKHDRAKYTPEQEVAVYREYIVARLMWMRSLEVDYRGLIPWVNKRTLREMTIDQLNEVIEDSTTLLRGQYPDWRGVFSKTASPRLHEFRPQPVAVEGVPPELVLQAAQRTRNVRRGEQNVTLMYEWMAYFHRSLTGDVLRHITLADIYDTNITEFIVGPAIAANWHRLGAGAQRAIRSTFPNLLALGQTHIANLEIHIPGIVRRDGAEFVNDNQNVHRSGTVKYVTDIYQKLIAIPVPADQNTLGELITHCKLPPKAIIMLTQHYCDPVSIYEIQGAYPKALDAVWAYIRSHPEKGELYMRVKDELTDNVGMCAQGNLSRICNIVSGYLDGIVPMLSLGERVQNAIVAIAGDDQEDKVGRAKIAMREVGLPENEWAVWLDALADM